MNCNNWVCHKDSRQQWTAVHRRSDQYLCNSRKLVQFILIFVCVLQNVPFNLMSGCQIILSSLLEPCVRFLSQNFKECYRKTLHSSTYSLLILHGCDSVQLNAGCCHVTPILLPDPHNSIFFLSQSFNDTEFHPTLHSHDSWILQQIFNNLPLYIKDISNNVKKFENCLKQFLCIHSIYYLEEYFQHNFFPSRECFARCLTYYLLFDTP
jgi:hypothetical protein